MKLPLLGLGLLVFITLVALASGVSAGGSYPCGSSSCQSFDEVCFNAPGTLTGEPPLHLCAPPPATCSDLVPTCDCVLAAAKVTLNCSDRGQGALYVDYVGR